MNSDNSVNILKHKMKVEGETGHDNNLLVCFGPDLRLYENCN